MMTHFALTTEIISGEGSLSSLRQFKNRHVLIVTDQMMEKIGLVNQVTHHLQEAQSTYEIVNDVEPNPSLETVLKGLDVLIDGKPSVIVAVGGGSVIDAAKAMVYFLIHVRKKINLHADVEKPFFVAIPTTSGTGSEVTAFSVITDKKRQTKVALADEVMIPNQAILDANLTLTVPHFVTADTGIDVVTHAVEAFVSNQSSIFSDVYAQKAFVMAYAELKNAFDQGSNSQARQTLHDASCMAGIAFTNAGLGINHSLAHAIGGLFKISHGRANAILLPHVVLFNSGVLEGKENEWGSKYEKLAHELGIKLESRKETLLALVAFMKHYNTLLDIPQSFSQHGIDSDAYLEKIPNMVSHAMVDICTAGNPREVTAEDLVNILKKAL